MKPREEILSRAEAADWPVRPLWSLARRKSVCGFPDAELLSVYREHGVVPKSSRDDNFNRASEDLSKYQQVEPGNLVLNKMKTWQGSLGVSEHEGIVSPAYFVCELSGGVHPRYLHHLMRSSLYIDYYAAASKGIRPNQWDLPYDDLRGLPVMCPPLEVQRRVAAFLDDQCSRVDAIVALRLEQTVALEALFAAQIRRGVAGCHLGSCVDSDVPWVGEIWEGAVVRPIRRSLTLQRGVDLTADERVEEGTVPVVTTGGIVGSHDRAIIDGPGVVIGRYGSVGNVHWVLGPCWPHNTTLYVKDFKGNDPRYLYWLLRAFPYDMQQARAAVPGVNRNDLHPVPLAYVEPARQRECVSWIDDIGSGVASALSEMKAQVDLLRERKRSLITAAVTGEFDVTTAGGRGVVA